MDVKDIQKALIEALQPEFHNYVPLLANILVEVGSSKSASADVIAHLNNPVYSSLLRNLAGQRLNLDSSIISFGAGHQLGDVTIGDVASGNIVKFAITVVNPAPQSSVPLQLRAPVGDFVGREREIDLLAGVLRKAVEGNAVAVISGLRGMGGIGKSELAYAVAWKLREEFPDGQILIELRGATNPISPVQALHAAIQSFESTQNLTDDLGQLQGLYRTKLQGKRILILADDARDASQARPLMPPPSCALIITSRNRFSLPGMMTMDLGMLPKDEAVQLLLEVCPRIGSKAPELAALCGYLPLALRVCSEFLVSNDTRDVAKFINKLEAERLAILSDPDNPDDPQASVEASLRLSYEGLSEKAQRTLTQLSVFNGSFDEGAARALLSDESVEDVLDLLRRRSLVSWNSENSRYLLHDLVRAFGMVRLKNAKGVYQAYAMHFAQLASNANALYSLGGESAYRGLELFDRERAHIDSTYEWLVDNAGSDDVDQALLRHDYSISLGHQIGQLRYPPSELIRRLKVNLEVMRRLHTNTQEAQVLHSLGYLYNVNGDRPTAVVYLSDALAKARELNDKSQEVLSLLTMGGLQGGLGNYTESFVLLEQALEGAQLISNRVREGQALDNLGNISLRKGDIARSVSFYAQALVLKREVGDIRGEARVLAGLGRIARMQGDFRQALELLSQALKLLQSIGDRLDLAVVLWDIGVVWVEEGSIGNAIEWLQRALDIEIELGLPTIKSHMEYLVSVKQRSELD